MWVAFYLLLGILLYVIGRKKKKKANGDKDSNGKSSSVFGLAQETKNGIWSIACFGLAVITTLAFLNKAGDAGLVFSVVASRLFGWGIFLIPLALVILGIAFLKSIHSRIYSSALVGTGIFVLGFLGLFYITGKGDIATRVTQGGYLGLVLGFPLLRFVGSIASFTVLFLVLIISILVALNVPIHSILFFLKPAKEEGEEVQELKDNVVVKRGSQIIDARAEEEAAKQKGDFHPQIIKPKPAQKSEADEEKEFVIRASKSGKWELPPIEMLHSDKEQPHAGDINTNVTIIKRTLSNFGIDVEMGEVSIGPTVTQFTLRPAMGIKLSRITALQNDLSLALAAHPIRIEAPIPGKALVGIEVPNKKSALVGLRDLIEAEEFKKSKYSLALAVGRDVAGFPVYAGLEKMPHMLIAGATGTGKSVAINALLLSLLYKHSPNILKLILVDPKRVELSLYNGIPHLITPVITDPKKVVNAFRWAVHEMERRYEKLSASGSRDINSYNVIQINAKKELMPYIIIVIDELADLMAAHGRDIEAAVVRLAQMARAVGIHLIVSTQRPSVEVITGLIKANITTRIALQVASQIDSRTIIDMAGADRLLGNGDMLLQSGDTSKPRRVQSAYVSEKEVKDVVKFIKDEASQLEEFAEYNKEDEFKVDLDAAVKGETMGEDAEVDDVLFNDAREVVIQAQKASASLLQRRLRVGYARAARLLDILEERGIIGPGEGAKPRDVFVKPGVPTSQLVSSDLDEKLDEKIATEE
ncbi:MAG: putative cell division FtsK/SpoIIIE [Parcubacteria group bacterium Licking1014_17]|nr:MAG: putative cell division FtsK/SpoIIIE [Parcubacteria group bacterium Licking1014_17]